MALLGGLSWEYTTQRLLISSLVKRRLKEFHNAVLGISCQESWWAAILKWPFALEFQIYSALVSVNNIDGLKHCGDWSDSVISFSISVNKALVYQKRQLPNCITWGNFHKTTSSFIQINREFRPGRQSCILGFECEQSFPFPYILKMNCKSIRWRVSV